MHGASLNEKYKIATHRSSSTPGFTVMEVVVSVDPAEDRHSKAVINIHPAGN